MNNEELDSQLSAMFDDELPAPECELLARRLARDEALKARWGRYAAIGACIRSELGSQVRQPDVQTRAPDGPVRIAGGEARMPGVRLNGDLAGRVSRMVAAEPPLLAGAAAERSKPRVASAASHWWQPVAGGAVVAAGVAAAAILWLRSGAPDAPIAVQARGHTVATMIAQGMLPVAISTGTAARAAASGAAAQGNADASDAAARSSDSDSFVVPPAASPTLAPPIELANFVVAHSQYSTPLLRRSLLSALIVDEPGGADAAASTGGPVSATPVTLTHRGGAAVDVRTVHAPNAGHSR